MLNEESRTWIPDVDFILVKNLIIAHFATLLNCFKYLKNHKIKSKS